MADIADLIARHRAAAESWETFAGVELRVRRPTPLEAVRFQSVLTTADGGMDSLVRAVDEACAFALDWRGVSEQAVFGSGGDQAVGFSREALQYLAHHNLEFANEFTGWIFEAMAADRGRHDEEKKA